jgi:hypothetical protein
LKILDELGNYVGSAELKADNNYMVTIDFLNSGIYVLDGQSFKKKLVIIH